MKVSPAGDTPIPVDGEVTPVGVTPDPVGPRKPTNQPHPTNPNLLITYSITMIQPTTHHPLSPLTINQPLTIHYSLLTICIYYIIFHLLVHLFVQVLVHL